MDIRTKVREAQRRILDHLAQCEEAIATLYDAYGRSFPEMAAFWNSLSAEEHAHVRLLKSLHKQLDKGNVFYNLGRFDTQIIDAYITKARAEQAALKTGTVSASQAVSVALLLETSLVDAHFYDIVTSDAPEFTVIADHLSKATRRHIALVRERLVKQHPN